MVNSEEWVGFSQHKTQRVRIYDRRRGTRWLPEIDVKMTRIVKLLNRPGLWTTFSCQGDRENEAYVTLGVSPLSRRFAHRLLDDHIDYPYDRIERLTIESDHDGIVIRWPASYRRRILQRFTRVLEGL